MAEKSTTADFRIRIETFPGKSFNDRSKKCDVALSELRQLDAVGLSLPAISDAELQRWKQMQSYPRVVEWKEVAKCYLGELMTNASNAHLTSEKPVGPRLLRGANINYYVLLTEPKQGEPLYLREGEFLSEYANDIRSGHHLSQRVGFQESSPIDNWRRLIGCVIPTGYYCVHKIRYFAPDSRYDLFAILAIFNSEAPEWRFSLTSTNNSVNGYEVDALPIPRFARLGAPDPSQIHVDTKRWETTLTDQESGVNEWEQAVLTQIQQTPDDVNAWPDTIHDALAVAGKAMSRLGEERQRLTNGFAEWLVEHLGIDDSRFSGMTYIKGAQATFDEMGWEAFRELLRRNRRACHTDPTANETTLKKRYDEVSASMGHNRRRFAALDAAIDRIVWQLVGLAPDGSIPA